MSRLAVDTRGEEELDMNRKLNIIKHRKKQAANDAQLLM